MIKGSEIIQTPTPFIQESDGDFILKPYSEIEVSTMIFNIKRMIPKQRTNYRRDLLIKITDDLQKLYDITL